MTVAPGSVTWERASDARVLLGAGAALVLQVAHPTVAAGVREHSAFERDPWGRLLRTLDLVNLLVYGGPEAAARAGRDLREGHKRIRGVAPDGRRYHALEPEAYAWVHATLAEVVVGAHARFGTPLGTGERERFWAEWRGLGRLLGVRERDLPEEWAAFRAYRDGMVAERLEDSDVVQTVLRSLAEPASPPLRLLPASLWKVARWPGVQGLELATAGLLPPALRDRVGLAWNRRDDARLGALAAATRTVGPLLPRALRQTGPTYLRLRGWADLLG